jgi:hypothetical protein
MIPHYHNTAYQLPNGKMATIYLFIDKNARHHKSTYESMKYEQAFKVKEKVRRD